MTNGRCLSWRFPTSSSSPMMKAPNTSGSFFGPLFQLCEAADVPAVDEHLRHGAAAGDRADHARAIAVVELDLGVGVAELLQHGLCLCAVAAAFAREERHLVRLLRLRVYVGEHRVGVGRLERVAGLVG